MCKLLMWGGWGIYIAGLEFYAAGLGIACVTIHCVHYYIGVLLLHNFFASSVQRLGRKNRKSQILQLWILVIQTQLVTNRLISL